MNTPNVLIVESDNVAQKHEKGKVGRWNCHTCKSSFNVLAGTLFQGTKIPLLKWFVAIALIINAKQSPSSCQLARHLGLNQGSTLFMIKRIRKEMERKEHRLLHGIIKADQIKPIPKANRTDGKMIVESKRRHRDTKKTPIIDEQKHNPQLSLFEFN